MTPIEAGERRETVTTWARRRRVIRVTRADNSPRTSKSIGIFPPALAFSSTSKIPSQRATLLQNLVHLLRQEAIINRLASGISIVP